MRNIYLVVLFVIGALVGPRGLCAAEVIPPSPAPRYIVDEAHVLHDAPLQAIDQKLKTFEHDTSNQVVVGIYRKMQSDDDIAAYAVRVFQAWHLGQKGKDNGVLVLVFVDDHKFRIATGYGLEGALPDATCRQIENEMKPFFKRGDFDGGVQTGVNAIIAATKGEYKGKVNYPAIGIGTIFVGIMALIVISSIVRQIFGTGYGSGGRSSGWWLPLMLLSNMGSSRSSGGWGGGGGGGWSGGGGGFSGGGGSTGGGGASGSW